MRLPITICSLALTVLLTACGAQTELQTSTADTPRITSASQTTGTAGASTTTAAGQTPFSGEYYASEMAFVATEIPVLVGLDSEAATIEANRRGWTEVLIHDLDSSEPFFEDMSLSPHQRVTLEVEGGIVKRAVAG